MTWIRVAAVVGFSGVALGAFGAHGLRSRLTPELLSVWQTGVLYHLIHAAVLLAVALHARATQANVNAVAGLFLLGIVLFSGSLYLLATTGVTKLGMVTPLGGLAFLTGWAAVAVTLGRA